MKGTSVMEQKFLEVTAKFEAGSGKIFRSLLFGTIKKSRLIKLLTHAQQHL